MFFFFPFVTLHVLCITIKVWQYMFYVQPNYYSPQLIPVALLPFTSTQTSLSLPHGRTVYSSRLSGNEDEIPSFHSTSSPVVHPCRTSFQSDNEETELLKRSSLASTRKNSHRYLHPSGWELRARKTFICTPIVGLLNRLTQLEEDISELHNMLHQSKELFEKLLERKAAKSLVEDAKVQIRNTTKGDIQDKLESDPGNLQDRVGQLEAENAKLKAYLSTYIAEVRLLKKKKKKHNTSR